MVGRVIDVALLAVGLLLFALTLVVQRGQILNNTAGLDFYDYYYSTKAFYFNGADIYDHGAMELLATAERGTWDLPEYVYPPYLTIVFLPLAGLGYETARLVWLVLGYGFFFGSVEALRRLWGLAGGDPPGWRLTWLVPLWAIPLYSPLVDHQWEGQSNLIVLCLMTWGIYFSLKRPSRFPLGEALVAAAGLLKLFPAIVWTWFAVTGRFKSVAGIVGWAAILTAATLLVIPLSEYLRFPAVLAGSMYVGLREPFFFDYSAVAALKRLMGAANPWLVYLVRIVPYSAFLVLCAREGRTFDVAALLRLSQVFVLLAFVMSPWWEHHLVLLIVPFLIAAWDCARAPRARPAALALLAFSAAYIGIVFHPLARAPFGAYLESATAGKFVAIVALLVALELLIRKPLSPRRSCQWA